MANTKAKKPEASPGAAGEKESGMNKLAQALLSPKGKSPYMLYGKALNNLKELVDNLANFKGSEGTWVASWLEYLGDRDAAERIRRKPDEFKKIVVDRYNEVKRYSSA